MIAVGEIVAGAVGSWKILRGDPQAMRWFDVSADGFWRSFGAFVVVAPAMLVIVAAEHRLALYMTGREAAALPFLGFALVQIGARLAAWIGTPLVYAAIAGPVGFARHYAALVVAGNWSTLLGVIPATLAALAYVLGLVSADAFQGLGLVALAFDLTLAYRVARAATGARVDVSVGLVLVALLVAAMLARIAGGLLGI